MTTGNAATELGALEPSAVWSFFSRIAAVPRPSKKEARVRQAVRAMAEEHGLAVHEDAVGNLVIDVPASPGFERAPITILQGHLDMVCEKNSATRHDFDNDPIQLVVDRDADSGEQIVRADGTTLGADNGIGLAMGLAAATSPDVAHGPLELLFTVDEESGMTGAKALTPDSFRGRRMLNLDSEEDDVLYIGCAGGCDANLTWELGLHRPVGDLVVCRVVVSGLRGGHSGGDIHENRGNAIKLLSRTLCRGATEGLWIVSIHGGQLRNAIPREAEAVVAVSPKTCAALHTASRQVLDEAIRESGEEQLSISVEKMPTGDMPAVLSSDHSLRLLAALAALPHGVLGMHRRIEGLVETSNNVATVRCDSAADALRMRVTIGTLARSSSATWQQAALDQIAAVGRLAGAEVETANEYPGWEPNPDSAVLSTCCQVYKRLFGEDPRVTAIHAGLECGIIGEQVGGMDTVSFGPRIEGAHSPDERVYVASVQKSWGLLRAVLAELARG